MAVANRGDSHGFNHNAKPARKELRDYQSNAITELRSILAKGVNRVVCQAATGAGKTLLAAEIFVMARSKGRRVMFVVPAISLIDQTVRSFWAHGITGIGVIQADHLMTDYAQPVQVASVQTLARRTPPDVDLVIVDECHVHHKSMIELMDRWTAIPFIGLSATPWAKGMGKYWEALLIVATTADLMQRGYLSQYDAYGPAKPDLSGVKTLAGDYHEGQLSEIMQDKKITGDAVETWLKHADWQPTLVFCVDRAHANHVYKAYAAAGIESAYIDANTPIEEREEIGRKFNAKKINVVVNIGTLTTGVDWDVRCIQLLRPTKSEMLYIQIFGRGLRTADGKEKLIFLDHTGTVERLGYPEDIVYHELDDGKPKKASEAQDREKKQKLPRPCSACKFMIPAGVYACPKCGFKPEKQTTIEHESGELKPLNAKAKKFSKEDKQKFYSMLKGHAVFNSYKPGWVAHKYRERFGGWPKGMDEKAILPDTETLAYIRHLQIKAAKSKKGRS
jgi:superfamily II DNA or RNA helicase